MLQNWVKFSSQHLFELRINNPPLFCLAALAKDQAIEVMESIAVLEIILETSALRKDVSIILHYEVVSQFLDWK